MLNLRAAIFYVGYVIATVVWGGLSVAVAWAMPMRVRFSFVIGAWTRFVLWWLRVTCGIQARVEGRHHLPAEPCILLVKHQSTWETLFIQTLISPQATLIKRELLWIPFFGWAFALLKPISIDRRSGRDALKHLINEGISRLNTGVWVTLFPEGTRIPWGEHGRFHAGGAALARAAGRPVVVVAHDAGRYWPAHRFRKQPGTIEVRISPPIAPCNKTFEINRLAQVWLENQMLELENLDIKVDD
jgi:1-acyl-sn-glycerol-3-phosphate acyltransferase